MERGNEKDVLAALRQQLKHDHIRERKKGLQAAAELLNDVR